MYGIKQKYNLREHVEFYRSRNNRGELCNEQDGYIVEITYFVDRDDGKTKLRYTISETPYPKGLIGVLVGEDAIIRVMGNERPLKAIENPEVREEIRKLIEAFGGGFLNTELEFVICHPVNPVSVAEKGEYEGHGKGRDIYSDRWFRTEDCKTKQDVQRKVLAWFSNGACDGCFGSEKVSAVIQNYIRRSINRYLGTSFSREDMELIYCKIGRGINEPLARRFIESNFDLEVLKK